MGPGGMRTVLFPSFQSMGGGMGGMSVDMYEFLRGVRPEGSGYYSLHRFQSKCLDWSEQKIDRYSF